MGDDATRPRVLIGNIFFSPRSFGGATVVAENMARELRQRHGWDVVVVTTIDDPSIPLYGIRRYATEGIDVFGVRVPRSLSHTNTVWDNDGFNSVFARILDHTAPDIVHMHCLQDIGGTCLSEVKRRDIPLVVTIHDCWWICERQFMINHTGRYCHQWEIDFDVCRHCIPDIHETRRRSAALRAALAEAALLLYPSAFHRDLHLANGIGVDRSMVNKNGVLPPKPGFTRTRAEDGITLRFGFTGGPGPTKGAPLIIRAFQEIDRTDYELQVVDAAATIDASWKDAGTWDIPGKLRFVPPYNQATIDDFFAEIDVLLAPSQWKESFGLTVREAMIRGVWVIATDAGGLAEDVIHGENGTVLPMDGDHNKLRQAIEELLVNPPPDDLHTDHISVTAVQADELNTILRSLVERKSIPRQSAQCP